MTRLMTAMYVYYDFYDLPHSSFICYVVFLSNIEVVGPHFLFEEVITLVKYSRRKLGHTYHHLFEPIPLERLPLLYPVSNAVSTSLLIYLPREHSVAQE